MKNLRLFDPLLSTLFENEDIVAIDKPCGFNAHTNDSKSEFEDQITEGLIEIYEKNFGIKLHVIHRLDQTTTGVMIFGKTTEATKKYADFFLNRETQKIYQFITKSKSQKDQFTVDKKIIHKARELEAFTEFKILKRAGDFELWMAKPLTGRNHQIRIHAASMGIPILGDATYGGAQNPFICLHNCEISFPNGITLKSKPPTHFEDFNLFKNLFLLKLSFEADRRFRLFRKEHLDSEAFRLVHSKFTDDITLDQQGNRLWVHWHKKEVSTSEHQVVSELAEKLSLRIQEDNAPLTEFRQLHSWAQSNSGGKKVLNLFHSLNGFSLKAAKGKALQVTTVDASKSRLNLCREKFIEAQLDTTPHLFYFRDSLTFLEQCKNKQTKFDLIVCEAPSFFRRDKGIFKIEKDLNSLIESCLSSLSNKGTLLFLSQSLELHVDTVRRSLLAHKNLELSRVLPPVDFELPGARAELITFIAQLKT